MQPHWAGNSKKKQNISYFLFHQKSRLACFTGKIFTAELFKTTSLTVLSFLPHNAFKIDTGTGLAGPQALRFGSQGHIGCVHCHWACSHHYLLTRRGNLTVAYCGQEVEGGRGWRGDRRFHLWSKKWGLREREREREREETHETLQNHCINMYRADAEIQPTDATVRGSENGAERMKGVLVFLRSVGAVFKPPEKGDAAVKCCNTPLCLSSARKAISRQRR